MNSIIVRYSEIGLKGNNKSDFEKRLQANIKCELKRNNIIFDSIERKFSRLIINTDERADLSKVFGIASYSYAEKVKKDYEEIKKAAENITQGFTKETTFRASAKRLDKDFAISSTDIERQIGALIVEKTGAKVKLKGFEKEVGIEILKDEAFVFENKQKGAGGLPVGIEGKVLVFLEDDNSIEAGIQVMKRGCEIFPIGYEEIVLLKLQEYSPKQLALHKIESEEDIDRLAEKTRCVALTVGQTLKEFRNMNIKTMTLRPLIAR